MRRTFYTVTSINPRINSNVVMDIELRYSNIIQPFQKRRIYELKISFSRWKFTSRDISQCINEQNNQSWKFLLQSTLYPRRSILNIRISTLDALEHPLNKINDADSFLLVEGTNSIWKGNTWKASQALSHFSSRLKIDYDARRPDEPRPKWEQRWRKMEGGQITLPLDLQGREWMDIPAIIGDGFFSVYFMTKYPFVYPFDSPRILSYRNFKFFLHQLYHFIFFHRLVGNLKYSRVSIIGIDQRD